MNRSFAKNAGRGLFPFFLKSMLSIMIFLISSGFPGNEDGFCLIKRGTRDIFPIYGVSSGFFLALDSLNHRDFRFLSSAVSGGFRLPLEPGNTRANLLQISGGKPIGGFHLAGTFGFSYSDRRGLYLVHNNEPYSGIPFLFADSSRGGFLLKGLILQSSISRTVNENLRFGLVSFYRVDQQVKSVFPKSFINRRHITAGIFFRWRKNKLQVSDHLLYEDSQDQFLTTRYSLEQNRTPVFIRIRGLDTPLISYGQLSEQRNQQINGLINSLIIRHSDPRMINLKLELFSHANSGVIRDGLSEYIVQGRWRSYFLAADLSAEMKINSRSRFVLSLGGIRTVTHGYHPELNLEIFEKVVRGIGGESVYKMNLSGNVCLWLGTFISGGMLRRTDLYNGILDYFPSRNYGFLAGFRTALFSHWELSSSGRLWGEFQGKPQIFTERTGWYYNQITESEENYFSTDKLQGTASVKIQKGEFPDIYGVEIKLFWSSARGKGFDHRHRRTDLELEIFRNLP